MTTRHIRNASTVLKILSRTYRGKGKTASDRKIPFEILISTILSARTRDETTHQVANALFKKFPTAEALANANSTDVERLIRRIGFFRTKRRYIISASQRLVVRHRGRVPHDEESLLKIPGVGRKTMNIVRSYAFGEPAIAVDTHVHRISNRLGWIRTRTPVETERQLVRAVPRPLWSSVNDTFVKFGKDICRPVTPRCWECPVRRYCRYLLKQKGPAGTRAAIHATVLP